MPPSSGQEYNYLQNRPHFQSYYLYPNNLANPETTTEVDLLYIFLHGMRSTKCTIESVALGLVYLHEDSSFEPWIQSMCLCWALAKSPPRCGGETEWSPWLYMACASQKHVNSSILALPSVTINIRPLFAYTFNKRWPSVIGRSTRHHITLPYVMIDDSTRTFIQRFRYGFVAIGE